MANLASIESFFLKSATIGFNSGILLSSCSVVPRFQNSSLSNPGSRNATAYLASSPCESDLVVSKLLFNAYRDDNKYFNSILNLSPTSVMSAVNAAILTSAISLTVEFRRLLILCSLLISIQNK